MRCTVADVMTTKVIAVTRDTDFKQLAAVLREFRVSACPVVDSSGRVIGVVSEADLLHKVADCDLPAGLIRLRWKLGEESKITAVTAGQLMTAPAVTIRADAPVQVAARVMRDRKLKRLPVVGALGELIGIVSRVDLLGVYDRRDDDILAEVGMVADELGFSRADLDVTVSSGVVTLAGSVASPRVALELAARLRHVDGVVAIRDRLTVGEPIGSLSEQAGEQEADPDGDLQHAEQPANQPLG